MLAFLLSTLESNEDKEIFTKIYGPVDKGGEYVRSMVE